MDVFLKLGGVANLITFSWESTIHIIIKYITLAKAKERDLADFRPPTSSVNKIIYRYSVVIY